MAENNSAAVHIPVEHQSAPAETWADKEVKKAAEEIRTGQFRPDLSDDADLLGMVSVARGLDLKKVDDPDNTAKAAQMTEMADSLALAQHPRVQEALARLETEKREARTTQEAIEKAHMLHEYNARVAQKNLWDGQGRWIGKENEESRIVNILTPQQFLRRLEAVIGEGRVYINRYAVLKRVAVLIPNTEYNRKLILVPGEIVSKPKDEYLSVGTLQYPCGPEWMVMKFDEYGVPTTPKYLGWRTVLLSLILKGVITEKEAHKTFPLGLTPAADWYKQQLFEYRSRNGVAH